MMLTPIPRERLPEVLGRFRASLADAFARQAFDAIAATSPERASGEIAGLHRREALTLACEFGMGVVRGSPSAGFNWDGTRLDADTDAFVIAHEIAHFQLASPERRHVVDFGLGAGPDTVQRAAAERAAVLTQLAGDREEAMVSLVGILWEMALGQPALASFLDQNWLEAAGTPRAAGHFTAVLHCLRSGAYIDDTGRPTRRLRQEPDAHPDLRAA
jgi:hypothetical protein